MTFQQMIKSIRTNPRKLFLIDSLGAITSAFSLGVILIQFESYFGMPSHVLYILAVIPCFFALYSFLCYWRFPRNWRPFMKAIAMANLLYCFVSMGLVYQFHGQLTTLGFVYFLLEFIIIISLVSVELTTAAKR